MRDEAAKDNRQTAGGISNDFIRNEELAISSTRNLQFSLCISLKRSFFLPQTSTWFRLFKNQTIELTVEIAKIYNGIGSRHG